MRKVSVLNAALLGKDNLMKEVRKHLRLNVNPHKSRVKLPSLLDNFNHTRNDQRQPTVRYFTCGRNVPKIDRIELEKGNPFKPLYSESEEIILKRFPTYVSATSRGKTKKLNTCVVNPLLERLQVPSEPLPCNIVIDDDPLYFEKPKGRPLKESFNRSDFKQTQRVVFFKNIRTGRSHDEVLKRKEHLELDLLKLEVTSQELDETKENLEKFVTEMNAESVEMVKKQLKLEAKRDAIKDTLAKHRSVFAMTKNSLYKKESVLANALYCRDLLLRLSPSSFQHQYMLETKTYEKIAKELTRTVLLMYEDFCRYNPEPVSDYYLDEAMEAFLSQIGTLGPPKCYFKNHWEIDKFLREIELSCSEMLDGVERLTQINDEIESLGKRVRDYHSRNKGEILSVVDKGSLVLAGEQIRANQLQDEEYPDLTAQLKIVTSGDAVLETIGLVECLHQEMFSSKKTFPMVEMMLHIEKEIFTIEDTIRNLDPKKIAHCKKKVEARENKKMLLANEATRQFNKTKNYITRMRDLFAEPVATGGIRKLIYTKREDLSEKGGKNASKKSLIKSGDEMFRHLQIDGICTRKDVEDVTNWMIRVKVDGKKPKGLLEFESATGNAARQEKPGTRSSASSEEVEHALEYSPSLPDDVKKDRTWGASRLRVWTLKMEREELQDGPRGGFGYILGRFSIRLEELQDKPREAFGCVVRSFQDGREEI
ncbi:unnamed protein product [Nesidiocoris tenuis]|uniref:Uncharacterized protein n=1 Tax=Nesidiocoris tenuis TaxID=355587 RepID=A0A6H5G9F4_9HEMI|nr:unnamed protein product [Nesidiocoris tenuis]